MSNSIVQSPEVWAGPEIRYAGVLLFDLVRIGGGITFGLSVATHSIGNELGWEIANGSPAKVLYYLGPELDFSTPSIANLEFALGFSIVRAVKLCLCFPPWRILGKATTPTWPASDIGFERPAGSGGRRQPSLANGMRTTQHYPTFIHFTGILPLPLEPPSSAPVSSSCWAASRAARYSRTARDASSARGQGIG